MISPFAKRSKRSNDAPTKVGWDEASAKRRQLVIKEKNPVWIIEDTKTTLFKMKNPKVTQIATVKRRIARI